jgi:pimeloyl-ACP methyl ester carboxylesterase
MRVETKQVQLAGGGHIAYAEYGDPAGAPVFFFHGWPSSHSMAELTDDAARELGVRIISPDRPGIRGSAFQQDRELTDWPPVVRQFADELAIEKFRILAISGGAPYAFVTGWGMPERVLAMAVVSGAPPIAELEDRGGLLRLYRWMLALQERHPELLRTFFRVARPFAALNMPLRFRPLLLLALQRLDADVLRDRRAFEACFESSRQAWRASVEGVIADAEIYARPWGFPVEDVPTPVRLWHGTHDRTFSYALAKQLGARLPNCQVRIVQNAGHYSLPIRHVREILKDLLQV